MAEIKKIKTALVSVFHKDGLDELLKKLNAEGVKFLSTGGTQQFIESLGYECQKVEDVTTYPSILGGRVKTLHPKVFGGILGRRDNEGDQEQMKKYEIPEIDLVIVDLYPFEQTVASGASEADIIEKIDIGGISLIRAAAKNFEDVVIVPSKAEYKPLLDIVKAQGAETTKAQRKQFQRFCFLYAQKQNHTAKQRTSLKIRICRKYTNAHDAQEVRHGHDRVKCSEIAHYAAA